MDFFKPKIYCFILLLHLLPHCGECDSTVTSKLTTFTLRLLKYRRNPPEGDGDPPAGDGGDGAEGKEGAKGSKEGAGPDPNNPSNLYANRFTPINATTRIRRRTAPYRISVEEECDYLAQYCLKTYQTGRLCGRTMFFEYQTFKNYCMLDYVNCKERYDVWQVMHMGQCYELKDITDYVHYEYNGDSFLDKDYIVDDQQWKLYK